MPEFRVFESDEFLKQLDRLQPGDFRVLRKKLDTYVSIAKRIILRVVARVIRRTKNDWDDVFLERRVFERLSHLAPALVIYWLAKAALWDLDTLVNLAQRGSQIYMIVVSLLVIDSLLDAVHDIYGRFEVSRGDVAALAAAVGPSGLFAWPDVRSCPATRDR